MCSTDRHATEDRWGHVGVAVAIAVAMAVVIIDGRGWWGNNIG